MITYVGGYALDVDWAAGVVGWRTLIHINGGARHVTLAEVIADHPAKRDEILRLHRQALTLLSLCQSKLQLELDTVEGMP